MLAEKSALSYKTFTDKGIILSEKKETSKAEIITGALAALIGCDLASKIVIPIFRDTIYNVSGISLGASDAVAAQLLLNSDENNSSTWRMARAQQSEFLQNYPIFPYLWWITPRLIGCGAALWASRWAYELSNHDHWAKEIVQAVQEQMRYLMIIQSLVIDLNTTLTTLRAKRIMVPFDVVAQLTKYREEILTYLTNKMMQIEQLAQRYKHISLQWIVDSVKHDMRLLKEDQKNNNAFDITLLVEHDQQLHNAIEDCYSALDLINNYKNSSAESMQSNILPALLNNNATLERALRSYKHALTNAEQLIASTFEGSKLNLETACKKYARSAVINKFYINCFSLGGFLG